MLESKKVEVEEEGETVVDTEEGETAVVDEQEAIDAVTKDVEDHDMEIQKEGYEERGKKFKGRV